MRVTVSQESLARSLGIVTRAVATRPSMPVLSNVLLATEDARFKISATNLELGITMRIGARIESDGAITVPARTISELVNSLPSNGNVELELDERTNTLNLRCGTFVNNIKGIEADQFPVVPEADAEIGMELPAQTLRAMIDQVVFAAAKEDNRPTLMGVLTRFDGNKLTMIAADGFRMALRTAALERGIERAQTLLIPARSLQEVSRIIGPDDGTVYISVPPGRNQAMFHMQFGAEKDVDLVSQLIDGKFPDVENLIPKNASTTTRMDTGELLAACRLSEIFARDSNYTTRLRIKPESGGGQVVVMAQSQEKGDNEGVLDATINGPGLEVSFNVRYLIEVLGVLETDHVVLESNGADKPGVIKPADTNDFVYVVMPMSVR